MLILNQAMAQSGMKTQSIQSPKFPSDSFEKNSEMLNVACNQTQFGEKYCSIWFADWWKEVNLALQNMHLGGRCHFDFPFFPFKDAEDVASTCQALLSSPLCTHWKRRALSDLLKLLDSCGLSKRRSTFLEDQSSRWLLQPSYDVQHLLLKHGGPSPGDDVAASTQSECSPHESLVTEWKTANQYYFKSISSIQLLQQICLNFHKDFTLEQVSRSGSFIDHLLEIQQEQRAAAYGFSENLRYLRKCVLPLENLFSSSIAFDSMTGRECCLTPYQHVTYKCMWQQKQLFDSLCAMMHEECLLLKTVESNHLTNCQTVKAAANKVHVFIEEFVPDFRKSKDLLDNYLLGHNRVITTEAAALHPYIISKQMEQLVFQNFLLIKKFEEHLCAFRNQDMDRRSVGKALLCHFEDILNKGNLIAEEYNSALQAGNGPNNPDEESNCCGESISELEAGFGLLGNITVWKELFESYVANLRLDLICDDAVKAIHCAGKLENNYGNGNPHLCVLIGAQLKDLHSLLDLVLTFSNQLLHDFLAMHRTVSIMTHVLANIFASLYSKGFGISPEDQLDDSTHDVTQDANGTGMGEGAGMNDVSDQINDEDQLLGTSEKPSEEQDSTTEVPNKNDKGIEMEQDFAADTFSVSEESGDDDNEDGEDDQLDSVMGETGADGEIVDEKLWDKEDDENPNNTNEKYESGPSVKDMDSSSRELRAKEDLATTDEVAGELTPDEFDKQNDENGNQDGLDGAESMEDMNIDKEEAFADPTGLKPDEPNQGSEEDIDVDEVETADPMEEVGPQELDETAEHKNGGEKTNSTDETLEEAETEQVGGISERGDLGNNQEENTEMDLVAPGEDVFKPNTSDVISDHVRNAESVKQPKGETHVADLRDVATEANWSNSSGIQNDVASMRGLPSVTELEVTVTDSSNDGKLSDDQPKTQFPQHDSSALQKMLPNPCHNVGDALDKWKERVNVSIDLPDNNVEGLDDMVDENADEFGFTSEFEKGTSQALGPATSDQIDRNINGNEPDGDGKVAETEGLAEMEMEKQDSEKRPIRSSTLNLSNKIEEQMEVSVLEKPAEESPVNSHIDGDPGSLPESLVSIKRSYMSEDIHQLGKLSLSDIELGKAHNLEEVSSDTRDTATALWRRYELLTTRLSQELAEQLRLVLEPTLASKLQGDYKTGKRINMKKVIPYIASHYRKDKIWLRRTRPNKRDYQVVIAVDDSRSMSESCCGDVAIEALVTVCRAISQLEVGNLAVASFGKKGNIRLLHDFDQPFTGEAGTKMISSLTFKQENTIADGPMVDLLKYLNNMLDAAVSNARLPSGQNPLQQLVLIIADGRFHEKENLKRCVRDALSRKRMVAFLLLDSPQESIVDLMEASFQGGSIKFSKYLDSFPFPYYVVLRNIEALPRTLANLLRQWFEIMQYSRD
ncbi:hypothetical protein F0562_024176 [Nyssa sinensis]|uniref:VWFA domain-containing protein n=1 Tax=Nyssa sinensis TaxID=561372 RepID=A0A5J5BGK2_9ASTE|nr:hypothetical protein F0562_024176 [Nyssa sinensis]